jgi:tRNA threonylcarbamoyladenosine biosynthesis protein TsaB
MKLLAIETSGAACSAARSIDGATTQRFLQAPRRHGELILSMIDELMAEAELAPRALDAIAFAHGPGSFTGLRIAASVAQGLAFGADLPVVGISTLAALAQGCRRTCGADRVLPALDARMGEVYWGAYAVDDSGIMRALLPDQVCPPEAVRVPEGGGFRGAGSGWAAYREVLTGRAGGVVSVEPAQECEARDIALLGVDACRREEAEPPDAALPLYIRDKVTDQRC